MRNYTPYESGMRDLLAEPYPIRANLPELHDLYSVIESMHDNVVIVDKLGVVIWVSSCFERTYGISKSDIVGRTAAEMEAEGFYSPSVASLVLQGKQTVTIVEDNQLGGRNVVTGVPIFDDAGDVEWVISYTIDSRYFLKLNNEYEKLNTALDGNQIVLNPDPSSWGVVAISPAMKRVLEYVSKVALVDTNVLITGESGVGKNVISRLIHKQSDRLDGPLMEINCAGIPANLLESELFGYEAGAFTGASRQGKVGRIELANGGTLVLDEIGELPLELQAKLLQVIQEKKLTKLGGTRAIDVDFRLIAATNQNLRSLVDKKRFRSDLFFRLNVLHLNIPPLRERTEDILPLANNVLEEANGKYSTNKYFSPEVTDALQMYSWPGNVRELRNVVERLVIISEQLIITEEDLPSHIRDGAFLERENKLPLKNALHELERKLVTRAYKKHKTTVATAKALGISQPSAARKIAKYCK
ncbi:sigma-54 interaction domain-containing protein [Halodesulfovibrio marinisediminis]|uniref:HTH-type transcriptional regulatory protein TyrR n=1 Tax=Halodesulfovibrio marinisediminis DSM 17456 TaxID=1121457 RepID=A0A1N6IRR5_9BACT|nr:sigma 54-interacting transcriptional regulator [Halodesulfovibrio marinisediminis]SIO34665.1 Transcriptional regulator containing PAS, AAA-type ATPase, and DNA-binding Fis domains [Halodesulfovibrio marinisediminis DSM 17456]